MSSPSPTTQFPVRPLPPAVSQPTQSFVLPNPLRPEPSQYARTPMAALTIPEQIATFSYDAAHALRNDDSSLRYFVEPPTGLSLEMGYDDWAEVDDGGPSLDSLLQAYARAVDLGKRRIGRPDVVTWRGMMTRILTALYETREGWEMNAMLVDGTLYLQDNKPPATRTTNPFHRKLMYTGYAFESYCTADHPAQTSMPKAPDVNTNMQWCSIVQAAIGPSRLVIGGEVDCVRGPYTGKTGNYVELKTSVVIQNPKDERNFERKVLKYWAQSYLLGIPEVVVGFRSPQPPYRLESLQTFQTSTLPRIGLKSGWSASACLNWGSTALEYLRARLGAGDSAEGSREASVWRVMFRPGKGLEAWPVKAEEMYGIEHADSVMRVGFLPRDYWDWVQGRRAARMGP